MVLIEIMQLRYFVDVAKELNLSKVADKYYLAQPTLSYQINSLEQELGIKLLLRSRKGLQLTPAGYTFYQYAERLIAHTDEAIEHTTRRTGEKSWTLRISYLPYSHKLIRRCAMEYTKNVPYAQLEMDASDVNQQIQLFLDGRHDCYFSIVSPPSQIFLSHPAKKIRVLPISTGKYYFLMNGNLLHQVQTKGWEELSSYPLLEETASEMGEFLKTLRSIIQKSGVNVQNTRQFSSIPQMLLALRTGIGYTVLAWEDYAVQTDESTEFIIHNRRSLYYNYIHWNPPESEQENTEDHQGEIYAIPASIPDNRFELGFLYDEDACNPLLPGFINTCMNVLSHNKSEPGS